MKVKKIGKPRKNCHSLDMLPVPSVVGALPSLERAPSSSQTMLAVGHNPLHSLSLAGWSPTLAPEHEHHPQSHVLLSWGCCGQMASGWGKNSNIALQKQQNFWLYIKEKK